MLEANRRVALFGGSALLLVGAVAIGWWFYHRSPLPEGFAAGNGRLEAEEIHIATKLAGRVAEVLVDEGDEVDAAQVLARMDKDALEAELHRASAQLREAEERRNAAAAVIVQRSSQCRLAEKELERAIALFEQEVGSEQQLDVQSSRFETAEAACDAAHAALVDAEAAIDAGPPRWSGFKRRSGTASWSRRRAAVSSIVWPSRVRFCPREERSSLSSISTTST